MKRLFLFFGSLPWGARLQIIAVSLILVWYAWFDFKNGNSPVTIGIVLVAWLIGWLLMPLMMAHQRTTFQIWSTFGVAFLMTYVLAQNQWWWHTMIAHYCREIVMWLDVSCGYWFISELRLQQERQLASTMMLKDDSIERDDENYSDFRNDDCGDERRYKDDGKR